MLLRAVEDSPKPGGVAQCINNLQQIASALINYNKANGHFPPTYIADQEGKPMTSWRMLILPYLERGDLYKAYKSGQAWNSSANKKVSSARVTTYECASHYGSNQSGTANTDYFAVVGPNSAWAGDKPRKASDFGSDASHTIMLVEDAGSAVAWAEPSDFSVDRLGIVGRDPRAPALSSNHRPPESFFYTYGRFSGVCVAMANGNVHFLRTDNLSPETLRKILQIGCWSGEGIVSEGDFLAAQHLNWPNIAALAVWLVSVGALLTAAERSRKARAIPPSTSATAA